MDLAVLTGTGAEALTTLAGTRPMVSVDDVVLLGVVLVVVDPDAERDVRPLGGRRDDDLLGAGVEMRLVLLLVGEEAGALEHDVDTELLPRELAGLLLGEDLDVLAADRERALSGRRSDVRAAMDRASRFTAGSAARLWAVRASSSPVCWIAVRRAITSWSI